MGEGGKQGIRERWRESERETDREREKTLKIECESYKSQSYFWLLCDSN